MRGSSRQQHGTVARGGHLQTTLYNFMAKLDLVASDVCFRPSIGYTYESDSGFARSWIDHVICSQASSALISGMQAVHLGSILSDHFPLSFSLSPLAQLFSGKDKTRFWSEIHRLNHFHPFSPPCVDGVSGSKNISNAFASKFQNVLNANPGSSFSPHITDSLLGDVYFSDDYVLEAIMQLKPRKYDSCGISTEHLKVCLFCYLSA